MTSALFNYWQSQLNERKERQNLRILPTTVGEGIDFYSNDYLGMVQSGTSAQLLAKFAAEPAGATGSRLISATHPAYTTAEAYYAQLYGAESALIFNSGYAANLGLFSCLTSRHHTILYDEYIHASIRDGIRLSWSKAHPFKHNDLQDLEHKLQRSNGSCLVVVESLYSMDGDFCPLTDLAALCQQYGAHWVVDEAHTTGIYGAYGDGLVAELELNTLCTARIMTFSKAIGSVGAVVIGSELLIHYLVNFSRPFIYTTALPPSVVLAQLAAVQTVAEQQEKRKQLHKTIKQAQEHLTQTLRKRLIAPNSSILGIQCNGNTEAKNLAQYLNQNGILAYPILSPTVPVGKERIRIILHTFNTLSQIKLLQQKIQDFFQ